MSYSPLSPDCVSPLSSVCADSSFAASASSWAFRSRSFSIVCAPGRVSLRGSTLFLPPRYSATTAAFSSSVKCRHSKPVFAKLLSPVFWFPSVPVSYTHLVFISSKSTSSFNINLLVKSSILYNIFFSLNFQLLFMIL